MTAGLSHLMAVDTAAAYVRDLYPSLRCTTKDSTSFPSGGGVRTTVHPWMTCGGPGIAGNVPDPLSLNLPSGGYADQRGKKKQGSESWRRFGSPALHNKNFPDLTVFHDGYLSPGCRHDKPDSICHLGNPRNRRVPCPVTIGYFQRNVVNDKMPP